MIQANANTSNTIINDLSYDDSIISGWMYKLAKNKLLGRESWHHRFMKFDISNGLLSISKDDEDNTLKIQSDKTSGNNKLKALGLTDDEIKALIG